jgi:hypothetical protein
MQYYNLTLTQEDILKHNDIYNDIEYLDDKYKSPEATADEKDFCNYLIRCKLKELEKLDRG